MYRGSRGRRFRGAAAIWLIPAAGLLACAAGLVLALRSPIHQGASDWFRHVTNCLAAVSYTGIGGLLIARRASPRLGLALCLVGMSFALNQLADQYALQGIVAAPGSLPGARWMAWVDSWIFNFAFPCGFGLVFLLFPNGHAPGRRWNLLLALLLGVMVASTVGQMFAPGQLVLRSTSVPIHVDNPMGGPLNNDLGRSVSHVVFLAFRFALFATILAMLSLVVRYRRADSLVRTQIKWLAYVALIATICLPAAFLGPGFTQSSGHVAVGQSLSGITFGIVAVALTGGLPLALGIAVMRYRLYDIDVVISRTLLYGVLAGLITAVYVGIVVGLGSALGQVNRPNLPLSIAATAVVAVGFQPVRELVQRVANRLVYGKRASPYEVLSEFSGRVAETYSGVDVLHQMARVLAEGTGADAASVWLRAGELLRPAATYPPDGDGLVAQSVSGQLLPDLPGADRAVAVRHQGELLGALAVRKRHGEALAPMEDKLLQDLAHQAGLVLKNVGLTADLQARLADLRESRKRLVAAQDQERRKLERNLHDGAQQHLVAIKIKLGLAEVLVARDPAKAKVAITELKGDADEALETLRDLARGIYPPLLADQGLRAALQAQVPKVTIPVMVQAEGALRYSQDTEAAIYFCCLEALQNIQKYAAATRARVRVEHRGGEVEFEVNDDGRGFEPATTAPGTGLQNMSDRLEALGGRMTVVSSPGDGTSILGRVPVTAI
ncbi:MAG: hypothetical protein NVS3B24_01670 [Candidatus Dormibacteria bacterium]